MSDASEPPSQGLKQEIIIAIGVVGGVLFIFIILAVVCGVFFRLQRKQIREYRSQFFPYIDGRLEVMYDFPLSNSHQWCHVIILEDLSENSVNATRCSRVLPSNGYSMKSNGLKHREIVKS